MAETKTKGLSSSFIKTIALICMFTDHFAVSILTQFIYNPSHPIMQKIGESIGVFNPAEMVQRITDIYQWMRNVGRISFPIYCFFIVEGFFHTRSRKKYARRLAACALLSEIPFDLALYGKIVYIGHQNVFFTLLIGLLAIWSMDMILMNTDRTKGQKAVLSIPAMLGFLLCAELLFVDYSSFGVATILVMFLVRKFVADKVKLWAPLAHGAGIALLCILSLNEVWAFLGLPFMFFYRGKKGWNAKWFFYFFYPVHLMILAVLACFCR